MVASHRNRGAYYGDRQEFRIIIEDYDRYGPDDVISPIDLGCYMILFGKTCDSIYTLGSNVFEPFDVEALQQAVYFDHYRSEELLENFASQIEYIWDQLPRLKTNQTLQQIAEEASPETGDGLSFRKESVLIRHISRNSPIEMICSGMPWVIMTAVIFSGGTIKYKGFECRIPPVGYGIRSLRQALSQNRRSRPKIPRKKIKDSIEKK